MDHPPGTADGRNFAMGAAAALAAALIWGSWIVVTRLGVTTTLAPPDVAFLRFGIPAVVLLPVLLREGLALKRIGIARTALMIAGSGLPFFLVSSAGMQFAPASHAGALLPGTMPLFVALLAALLEGERFSRGRVAGFGLVVAGVLAIGGYHLLLGNTGAWRSDLLFLGGAFLWALYTLAFRRAGIGAWHAAALINAYSIIGLLPLYLWTGSQLPETSWPELGLQSLSQGLLSGIVALLAYGIAVRRLGAPRAAVFISLTPVIAALIAIPVLGEWPDAATAIGIATATFGVALASGALGQGVRSEDRGLALRPQHR
jgi:drug/metabolite transporter (DMT)-like permease